MKIATLFLFMMFASCSMANEEVCLEFSEGTEKNNVKSFLKSIKRDGRKNRRSKFYSSSYDLNGDGFNEYFYYFQTHWSCGSMGCNLMAYESKDGKFRRLFKGGLYPTNNFKPNLNEHEKYICILPTKDDSWQRIKVNNQFEMKYADRFYKTIK
ncbi:hypothetical protein ACH42_17380 [Endozoicomonas sp. (ex Bugula neritina AB1)]|nr:hypothetical protein ACH42_17380 [Endozoicomonas sp. (ex Bugula neritina AB1)]